MTRCCYCRSEEVVLTKKLKGASNLYNKCIFTKSRMKTRALTSDKKSSMNEVKKINTTDGASDKSKSKKGQPSNKKISSFFRTQNPQASSDRTIPGSMQRRTD